VTRTAPSAVLVPLVLALAGCRAPAIPTARLSEKPGWGAVPIERLHAPGCVLAAVPTLAPAASLSRPGREPH